MLNTILQDTEPLVEDESVEKTLSIIELITTGGTAGIIIILILALLFVVAVYIYFERLFAIRAAIEVSPTFMPQIRSFITQGKLDGAQQLCIQENVPVSRLVSKGLSRIGRPLEDINTAIENKLRTLKTAISFQK